MFVPNFKILRVLVPEKSLTKNTGEKKWTNKGNDKHKDAESLLHDKTGRTQFLTKFQNPRCSSSLEIFDKKSIAGKKMDK